MSGNISVNEILIRIQKAAREKDVNLTYTNMRVYLSLLDYARKFEGKIEVVRDSQSIRFDITTLELANYCAVAPRTITESLRKLKECGIIRYTIQKPKPSTVKLYKRFYE